MIKCDRCGGSGKLPIKIKDWYPGKPYPICPDCHGTGTNPEPEVISKSVHRRLAVQNPEPEPDDRIREAFEESGPIRYYIKNYNIHLSYAKDGYCLVTNGKTGLHHIKEAIKEINHKWDNFKHGYTSRNAEIEEKDRIINDLKKISHDHVSYMSELSKKETEIEALKSEQHDYDLAILNLNQTIESLKSRLMASEGAVKMLNDMDDENQKTIQSLHCCGNCDNLRTTPQDHDFCWKNNGNLPSERICKYWTRKPK